MKFFTAPSGWSTKDKNPFSIDGLYGPQWTCLCLDDINSVIDYCGCGETSLYTFRLGYNSRYSKRRIADFLRYEKMNARNVILSFPSGVDIDSFVADALITTPEPDDVRKEDPRWVVHSTNLDAWKEIQQEGCLKSLSLLHEEGKSVKTVGFHQLGEPPEFADYIMFGKIDVVNSEHVVASQQKGYIFTEADVPYTPGVRLYFDNHKLIKSGLGIRDGLHTIKVYHKLSLVPFLKEAILVTELALPQACSEWTPNTFYKAANTEFYKRLQKGA
jgi:hypothetical protein